ncbi:unnamed protein product [Rotaria sp. Silwood2]|nr:unnamed protein product [Rotaria sp. Silwood2]CAF3108880.1 unnamed protein product [Rotaria sp. Silwood2]
MFSSQIEWHCTKCESGPTDRRKYCADCDSMLIWTCTGSQKSSLSTNYYRHRDNCDYCTPKLEEERQKNMEEKKVAIQEHFQILDDSPTNYVIKVQIACDFRHLIVHVSECYYGSKHDITVLRESGLLEHVEESVQIIGDKGYIGEEYVVTPRKKPYGRELTQEDKDFNRDINSARAAIENINQHLKTYAILGSVYRGSVDDFHKITKIIQVVAALCNLNLNKHLILFFLLIAHVASYPSLREVATNDEESDNDLQLELRSILNHLDNEQMERSIAPNEDSQEDDSDQNERAMNKRQGGYNVINPDLKCEIECVGKLRNPETGQGMSVKDATKACKNICASPSKKREQKKAIVQQKEQRHQKSLRESHW